MIIRRAYGFQSAQSVDRPRHAQLRRLPSHPSRSGRMTHGHVRSAHNLPMETMNASDAVELIDWLQQHGIDVWLNGGWGVDALLGRQTREHEDLDITISASDRDAYTPAMQTMGFAPCRVDNDFNWVLVDSRGRLVDVHLVDFSETTVNDAGVQMYGHAG